MSEAEHTRTELSLALIDLIENAPEEKAEKLFKAIKEYRAWGNREKAINRQPIASMLFDAIDEGLMEIGIGFEIEADEKKERVS